MDCAHCALGENWGNLTRCFPKKNVRNKVISNNNNRMINKNFKNPSLIFLKTNYFKNGASYEEKNGNDEIDLFSRQRSVRLVTQSVIFNIVSRFFEKPNNC